MHRISSAQVTDIKVVPGRAVRRPGRQITPLPFRIRVQGGGWQKVRFDGQAGCSFVGSRWRPVYLSRELESTLFALAGV